MLFLRLLELVAYVVAALTRDPATNPNRAAFWARRGV